MKRLRRLFGGLLTVAMVVSAGFAAANLSARAPQGCCGLALSGQVCSINQVPFTRCDPGQEGDALCYQVNVNFPHCCYTEGWCGTQGGGD